MSEPHGWENMHFFSMSTEFLEMLRSIPGGKPMCLAPHHARLRGKTENSETPAPSDQRCAEGIVEGALTTQIIVVSRFDYKGLTGLIRLLRVFSCFFRACAGVEFIIAEW